MESDLYISFLKRKNKEKNGRRKEERKGGIGVEEGKKERERDPIRNNKKYWIIIFLEY